MCRKDWSLSMRREWVELLESSQGNILSLSLSMRREWVEIFQGGFYTAPHTSLSPCGESGLKYLRGSKQVRYTQSLSMRREWVEIFKIAILKEDGRSLSMRREWVEIVQLLYKSEYISSLSMRREWVEIHYPSVNPTHQTRLSPCGERL